MNVAAHVQNLGIPAVLISRVGNDALGEEIKAFMSGNNCSTDYVQTDETHGTGVVQVTLSETNQASYDIVYPISWDFIAPSRVLNDLVSNAAALIFGTLACRDVVSRTTLLGLIGRAKLKVYDVNLRAPHYAQNIIELLLFKANIVKMNDEVSQQQIQQAVEKYFTANLMEWKKDYSIDSQAIKRRKFFKN